MATVLDRVKMLLMDDFGVGEADAGDQVLERDGSRCYRPSIF